jgi:hypothetical protein
MQPAVLAALSGLTWHASKYNQVGLALYNFRGADILQGSLFDDTTKVIADEKLQEAMDSLHSRYGRDSITRAAALPVSSGTIKDFDLPIVETAD